MKIVSPFLFAFLLLFGCTSNKKKNPEASTDDSIITVKIIQLNDVYEIAPLDGGKYGGMARVAYIRDSIKSENPNTFLVMAGDFLNPSLLGTLKHNGERIRGKQMIDVMNAMDFDLATFGNHEFDLSEKDLQKRLNESNFKWISANCLHQTEDGTLPFKVNTHNIPEYHVFSIKGENNTNFNLGFFGVTINSNPKDYVLYQDFLEASARAYSQVEKEADAVLGLTHLTIEQDKQIANKLPNVPLIIGGHEHYNMLVETNYGTIAKADANAKTIYIHTLKYNTNTNDLAISSFLKPVDERTKENIVVKEKVDAWGAILNSEITKVIPNPDAVLYTANPPLDGTDSANRGIQTNLGELITKAMTNAYKDEVTGALVNGGSIRVDDMLSGAITSTDIFRILPFGGGVLKVELTGELLLEILDYGKKSRGTGAYLQRNGFSVSPKGEWLHQNKPIVPEEKYSIAFSDYLLKGLDIPFLHPDNPGVIAVEKPNENERAYDIRKAIIVYLESLNQ